MKFHDFSGCRPAGVLIVLLLGYLLLPGISSGRQVTLTSAQLPYTASSGDTLQISGTKISSTVTGIICSGKSDVVMNFGTDTLVYGTANGGGVYGINIGNSANHIKILGGTILHGGTTAVGCDGIYIGYSYNIYIENTDVIVYGDNAHCISANPSPSGYNIEVNGGDYRNNCDRYNSRCAYDGAAMIFGNANPNALLDPNFKYHVSVHGVNIHTTPGQGIAISGSDQSTRAELAYFYDDTINVDSRNLKYLVSSGTCLSAANCYGILCSRLRPGSKIYNNVITSGHNYGGGRGIMIENCMGASTNWIEVYNNNVDVHEGPNVEYGEGLPVHGFRIRAIDGGTVGYVKVYDNTFICTGDDNPATKEYNNALQCCRISTSGVPNNITIERNHFKGISLTSGVECRGICFDNATGDPTLIVRYNRIETDNNLVQWGQSNSGADNCTIENDTLKFLTPSYNPMTYLVGHLSNSWNCANNVARDVVYESGTSDTDITLANAGTLQLSIQRTLEVHVLGNNSLPVSGASVWVTNKYGRTVVTGTTNGAGIVSGVATYWFQQLSGADSTQYNDFTVKAKKANDSTTITYKVTNVSAMPVVTLKNTAGTQGDDVTPPAKIIDLGVADPGESSLTLNWTAPGDDGSAGQASEYDIRYSTSALSAVTWGSATRLTGMSSPGPPGGSESFPVTDLAGGNKYYFGIKTGDEVPNWSELSNIVSYDFSDRVPPGVISDLNAATGFNAGEIYLRWTATGDDGSSGEAASYEIRYSPDSINELTWPRAIVCNDPVDPLPSGSEMSYLMTGLTPGDSYYVALKAYDDAGNPSPLSNVVSASAQIDISLEKGDTTIVLIQPAKGSSVASSRPILIIQNIDSTAQNVYRFEVATDSTFIDPMAVGICQEGTGETTQWKVSPPLPGGVIYFWHAIANSGDLSPISDFSLQPLAHVYPNPFVLSADRTATFTGLPENSSLILMTISGSTVKEWSNVRGGEVIWGGTNESGKLVATGTYLWFVEGTDLSGKIIVRK